MPPRSDRAQVISVCLFVSALLVGCSPVPESAAQSNQPDPNAPVAVETAVAQTGTLETAIEYTGTTTPLREVSLRAQTEGRLLDLQVDVGDKIRQGQALGQVDSQLLLALVGQEQAELAALESEVAQAEAEVGDARAQVEQARVTLEQAQADAARLQSLASDGAITAQESEQAVTEARTAEQALRSAQEQVRTRQQAVAATQRRVTAQQATLAEVEAREAYAALTSPITGAILERAVEPGDLVQPGDEVLTLGDFSAIKVRIQVSELELSNLRVGQAAQVKLDAFPKQSFRGQVTRISPAADPTARLVPIEVTIPNANGQIGSGLLARVKFQTTQGNQQVIVPETALQSSGQSDQQQNPDAKTAQTDQTAGNQPNNQPSTLFVLEGTGEQAKAVARQVTVGETLNNQTEIRSGLKAGETFVVRSAQPLKDGQSVKLSILSETES
jgi:HlyD family secretion protein